SYNQQQQQQQPPPVHRQQQSNYLGPETGTGTENPYQSPPISPPAGPPLSGHQYPNPTIPPPSGPSPLSLSSALGNYGTQQQQQQQTQYLPKSQSPLGQYHRQSPMTQSPINQSPMNRYQTPPPQPLSQAQTQMQRHQSLRVTSANANDPMHGVLPGLRPVLSARADSRNGYTERRQSFGHTPISAVLSSSESPAIAQTLAGSGGMADGPKPQFRAGDGALPTGGVQGGIPPAPGTNSAAAAASASHGVVRHDSSSGYHSNAYGAHNRESFHTSPGGRQQGATTMSSLVSSMGALSVGAGGGLSHHLSPPPPPPPPPRSATAAYAPAGALAAASSLSIPSQQFHASQATLLSQSAVQLQPPPMQPLSHIGSTYSGAGGLGGLGSHSTLVGSAAAAAAVPGGGSGGGGLVASNKIQQQLAAMHSSVPGAMNQQQQNNASLTFAQAGENMAYPLWNNISATSFQAYRHQIPVPQSNLSGTKYALIIGINYYNESYSQTSNINGAHTLKTVLVSRYGYKERNVVLLSDDQTDSRNHPTHHTITTHIKRMMHGLQPNDSVFFYYCGFGRLPIQLAEDHTEALSSIRRLREDLILPCDFEQHGAISSTYLQKHLVCGLPQSTRLTAIFNCIANDTVLGVPYKYVHSNGCAVLTSAIAGNNLFEAEMKLGNASLTTGSFGDLSQRFETSLMQQQQQQQALVMGSGNRTDQTASDMDRIRQLSGDIIVFGWDRSYADPRCKNYMAQTPSTMLSTYWMTAMDTIHRSKGQVTFGDLLGSLQNSSKDIVMMPFIASGRKLSMDEVFNM
ncbi:Ca(2+)-dependent cysteine protease, partial [Coemansia sp. RSA 1939]